MNFLILHDSTEHTLPKRESMFNKKTTQCGNIIYIEHTVTLGVMQKEETLKWKEIKEANA